MRILHIGEYVSGGVATYLKTLMKLDKNIIETYLAMSEYASDIKWDLSKDRIYFYPYKRKFLYVLPTIRRIYLHIRKINPDIIHIHSTWAGVYVRMLFFLKKKECKIVYTPHGWSFLMDVSFIRKYLYVWIEKILSRKTDVIINISKYEQERAILNGIKKEKMCMIYNGIDEKIKERYKERNLNFKKKKINLLFVGRLDKQKGLDLFLKIYNDVNLNTLHLYVIGKNITDKSFFDKSSYKDNDKITWMGWIENSKLDLYYQNCDAVIIPSRWEGFGIVAIEAMKNKKAIIASNRGALPELIQNGKNGYIFDMDNLSTLKTILQEITRENLRKMGELGYEKFKNYYTAEKFRKSMLQLYKELYDFKRRENLCIR